jgi:hypothetical protein
MKKMITSAAKWAQSGANIAYNWDVPAVLRNLARECFKIRDYLL